MNCVSRPRSDHLLGREVLKDIEGRLARHPVEEEPKMKILLPHYSDVRDRALP